MDRLEEIYGDGRWILAVSAAAGATGIHDRLAGWGSKTLVVASNEGTGELPDTEIVYTRSTSGTVVGEIRAFFKSVEEPAPELLARVDIFDPSRGARVISEDYATAQEMVERPTFGVRRPEWSA